MSSKVTRVAKWVVLLAAIGGVSAFFLLRKPTSGEPLVIRKARVDRGPVEQIVTATGTLSAVVTVQVGSQVSGTILKLFADFNDRVKAGQLLVQLDPTRFKASLEQAQANLKNAEASAARARVNNKQAKLDYDRAQALLAKGVIGQAEVDALKSKYELSEVDLASSEAQVAQARAQVGIARVDLERTTIRSPIDGVVLQRAVDTGQTVAASLQAPTLFTIAQDLSRMEVRAAIDEADVGKLKEGLEAHFTVDAYPGEEFNATIHQIRSQPTVNQSVVTYDAILRVDNPEGRLRPGMTANVRVVTEKRDNVIRVPNAALRFKPAPEMVAAQERGPRGPHGGSTHTQAGPSPGGPGGPPGGAGGPGGWSRGGGQGGPPRGPGGEAPRLAARVYRPMGEKVTTVVFKPGIADDEYTEVAFGPLKPGDEIVIEATGGPMAGRDPRMNPNRNRGPRFF